MNEETTEIKELTIIPAETIEGITASNVYSTPAAFEYAQRVAKAFATSDLVPDIYKGKISNCLLAFEFSMRLNVSPLLFMQHSYVHKGKVGINGAFVIALLNQKGGWVKGVQFKYAGDKATRSCYCYGILPDGEEQRGTVVSFQMAEEMGWTSNPKWKQMTDQMLAYRAAAFFSRLYAPQITQGLQVEDEIKDIPATRGEVVSSGIQEKIRAKAKLVREQKDPSEGDIV